MASNDHDAVGAWLASKRSADSDGKLTSTQRVYRKEAERLLLWAILERKKALSSLSVHDATAYRSFLAAPPAIRCGPRYRQRCSPLWCPLDGPLGTVALRQSLIIVRGLFSFWVSQGYVVGNPFAAVALPSEPQRALGSNRTLTFAQWDHIDALLQMHGATEVERRLRRGMRWVYATGVRLAEITAAKCEDLEQVDYRTDDGANATVWLLTVTGKGGRSRQVPVPAELSRNWAMNWHSMGLSVMLVPRATQESMCSRASTTKQRNRPLGRPPDSTGRSRLSWRRQRRASMKPMPGD